MRIARVRFLGALLWLVMCPVLCAQVSSGQGDGGFRPAPLDAARSLMPVMSKPLPEEYLWTAGEVTTRRPDHASFPWSRQDLRTAPHLFRAHFHLAQVPPVATFYLAGPREAEVYLNGRLLGHFASDIDAPIGIHVFHADAQRLLRSGENVIAIRAVRGRGIVSADASPETSQLAYGEVVVAKLIAAAPHRAGETLLVSDGAWRSAVAEETEGLLRGTSWLQPEFEDGGWPRVVSLGPIESSREFRQWSADAGMYDWPGYQGMSSPLGTYRLAPVAVTHVFAGQSRLAHVDALMQSRPAAPFTVQLAQGVPAMTDAESPSILLDFGRELAGRLLVHSGSDQDAVLSVAYGESELEAMATGLTPGQRGGNYLGTNLLEVPAHGEARGPKSGFRFVRLRFLRGSPTMSFPSVEAEGIAYPVSYAGSFESSDARLNRIWETGAYTVHLCMQDDLWDAPKRDRGRWAGDIDVEGRVISDVFGEQALLEQTLAALVREVGPAGVNGIPNYSALWLTSLATLYEHTGDAAFVRSQHDAVARVVRGMDESLDGTGVFSNRAHHWLFVDWSPGLYGMTAQAVLGTNLQYVRGYRAAARLMRLSGDDGGAQKAEAAAVRLAAAVPELPASPLVPSHDWQLGALAVGAGVAGDAASREAVWARTLSHVKQDSPDDPVISPYFNSNVLDAMVAVGHSREALDWIRTYWGGMLDEGATSFWESYDLRWPKDNPHLSLEADGTSGFFVSLAHGWSAGPTAWLMENVLGVREPVDGYREVTLAPRLLGLAWVKGTVPTPHGVIRVEMEREGAAVRMTLDVPRGVEEARLALETTAPGTPVLLDGKQMDSVGVQEGRVTLRAGRHTVSYTPAGP